MSISQESSPVKGTCDSCEISRLVARRFPASGPATICLGVHWRLLRGFDTPRSRKDAAAGTEVDFTPLEEHTTSTQLASSSLDHDGIDEIKRIHACSQRQSLCVEKDTPTEGV